MLYPFLGSVCSNIQHFWVNGWYNLEHNNYKNWLFSGSIYSLKPGQSYHLFLPLNNKIDELILETDKLVNINVFPVTGKHIEMSFCLKDIILP